MQVGFPIPLGIEAKRQVHPRQFAREVKAGIDIDRAHLFPGLGADGERVIGLAPRRRRAVNEVRHLPDGGLRIGQQRIAGRTLRQISNPRHRQFRPRQRQIALAPLGDRHLVGQVFHRAVECTAHFQRLHQPLLEA